MSVRIDLLLEYMKEYDKGNEIDLSSFFGRGYEPLFKYISIKSFEELESLLRKNNTNYKKILKNCLETNYSFPFGKVYWIVKDKLISVAYDQWDTNNNVSSFFKTIERTYGKKCLFETPEACQAQLQQDIAENIKERIVKNPTMHLEQEEVLEDNSILLTVSI